MRIALQRYIVIYCVYALQVSQLSRLCTHAGIVSTTPFGVLL